VSDLPVFLLIVGVTGALAVVIGILVAPLVGRLADRSDREDDGDRGDEPD
jgi:hypothetical protein